ncbi:zinc ribbon domain-containing protein [Methanobrevibacter sp.]|uniref:zinc ribbon domain-containing protein n=1 Tax=Methanobrevibacter sp. TaxID=66852 RepID=UPI0025F498EB|nr:zinc ribbon domain-containing protein [Methanobrevibacter sp.]MBQ2665640.1 zinc ribbon domain-containing protein [Methanobrevibacter sp.]
MVKCPRCGYENSSSAIYCDNCAYLLSKGEINNTQNTKKEGRSYLSIAKKIIIVIGIIIIMFLLFSFIYDNSQPTQQESLNIVGDDGSHHQTSSYPYTAVIKYEGSWYAEMGDPNYLVKEANYGSKYYVLDCAGWERICVDVQKQDYGDGELKVQLLRNGEVVAENTTTEPLGKIVIHYNY